jgi:two-component system, chemotaxis family, chemotaxis protein CheY
VHDDDATRRPDPSASGALLETLAPSRAPASILVVDDDPDVITALTDVLAAEGYAVRGARDGIEALDAIVERRPDLIITDLMMPTMTGFELLGALHENPELATIPTLIITAGRGAAAQHPAGATVFPKPLDLERLLRAISLYTTAPFSGDDPAGRN